MITLKNNQITSIDYNRSPNGTHDNIHGQRLLLASLVTELRSLPKESELPAEFIKKVEYLRTYAFAGVREDAEPLFGLLLAREVLALGDGEAKIHAKSTQVPDSQDKAAESIPDQTRIKCGSIPGQTQINPDSDSNQNPDQPRTGRIPSRPGPTSPLDELPPEDQEFIYRSLLKSGIRATARFLPMSRPDGLGITVAYGSLRRFLHRYPARLADENRREALATCDLELSNLPPDATAGEQAMELIKLRLIRTAFDPSLNDNTLGKLISNLTRLTNKEVAERRIALAEERNLNNRLRTYDKHAAEANQVAPKARAKY